LTESAGEKIHSREYWTRMTPVLATGLLAAAAISFLFFLTFIDTKVFDDEGTFMITFREILDGRILYNGDLENSSHQVRANLTR
jgi:hypothetical protein